MRVFALSVRLRLGALVLLASVLPLAAGPLAPASAGAGRPPSAWLRVQVHGAKASAQPRDARVAFDRALAAAEDADTRTLHDFLSVFLGAHAHLTDGRAPATAGRSPRALAAELRHRLAQTGLTVQPPVQMSAPLPAPLQRARTAAASLLVPTAERTLLGATGAAASPWPAQLAALERGVAARLGALLSHASLFRALFAGRRLGP